MSRPLRLEFAGAFYHALSRGNARQTVFHEPVDFESFLDLLGETCLRFDWHCHAYCLMPNHYHLLIETRSPTLSAGMRHLNGVFTQRYNRRRKRVGHVFQGRFKALLVQDQRYLLELTRYIVLNPPRARLTAAASDWRWSSYAWLAGTRTAPAWASPEPLWLRLANEPEQAVRMFLAYLREPHKPPAAELSGDGVLGDDDFKRAQAVRTERVRSVRAIPRAIRFIDRPALGAILTPDPAVLPRAERDERLRQAVDEWRYTQAEVARFVGLDPATVSRLIGASRRSRNKT